MPRTGALAKLSDACLVSILVWMAIPEMWTKPLTVGEVPVHFLITQVMWSSMTLESLLKRAPRSRFLWLVLAAITYATARSLFAFDRNHWDLKYFVSDLWTVQVFVLGFVWSRRRPFSEIARVCWVASGIIIPLALLTMIGLYLDAVKPADPEYSDRVYTSSLWSIACVAQFMWPILAAYSPAAQRQRSTGYSMLSAHLRICRWLLAPTGLLIAVFTATRSLLIVSLVMCAVVWAIEPNRGTQRSVAATAVLLVLLGGGLTLASVIRAKGYSVLDRFEQTDLALDGRVTELQWMVEQLGDDYISGWGLGSLFHSTIRYHNREFETAPHIGIATYLLKGGLPMAITFVFVPLMLCVPALTKRTPGRRAGVGCVVVYLATASLSGGWFPYQLLLFGVGVGMLAPLRRQLVHAVPQPSSRGGGYREPASAQPLTA